MSRKCGDCQLCCRVLPISELGKKAGVRCSNQKFGVGCKVHGSPRQPFSCRFWSCWWLLNPAFDLPRPDRAGYVVDMSPDFVVLGADVFKDKRVPALQVWADPKRPDAWRGGMDWIKRTIEERDAVCVVRFDSRAAIVVVPPKLSDGRGWIEVDSYMMKAETAASVKEDMIRDAVAAGSKAQEA